MAARGRLKPALRAGAGLALALCIAAAKPFAAFSGVTQAWFVFGSFIAAAIAGGILAPSMLTIVVVMVHSPGCTAWAPAPEAHDIPNATAATAMTVCLFTSSPGCW